MTKDLTAWVTGRVEDPGKAFPCMFCHAIPVSTSTMVWSGGASLVACRTGPRVAAASGDDYPGLGRSGTARGTQDACDCREGAVNVEGYHHQTTIAGNGSVKNMSDMRHRLSSIIDGASPHSA